MASPIAPGANTLDGPPPSPANPPSVAGGMGPSSGMIPAKPDGPMPGGTSPSGDQGLQMVVKIGAEIDRGLMALAQIFPDSAEDFRTAKAALQSGLAKALASASKTSSMSTSPTSAGAQFPGSSSPPKY